MLSFFSGWHELARLQIKDQHIDQKIPFHFKPRRSKPQLQEMSHFWSFRLQTKQISEILGVLACKAIAERNIAHQTILNKFHSQNWHCCFLDATNQCPCRIIIVPIRAPVNQVCSLRMRKEIEIDITCWIKK